MKLKLKLKLKRDVEDPAMQEAEFNRLLRTALDQANAQHEEKLKELDCESEET